MEEATRSGSPTDDATLARQVRAFLSEREREMFALLEKMVLTQSGTSHKAGVDRMLQVARDALATCPLRFTEHVEATYGNHLEAVTAPIEAGRPGVLLMGHMDTVFPADTHFNWYREDETKVYGPGVVDMKGGLVVIIYALKALHALDLLAALPLRVVFNSDEEVGSPSSKALIERCARESRFAFVAECGGLNGEIATGRRGRFGFRLLVKGLAGHAATAGGDKASAVLELAHKIIGLEGMNDPARGVSVNVGKVEGGIGPNSVPESAVALVDIRFPEAAHYAEMKEKVETLCSTQAVPGVQCTLEITSERTAMPCTGANRALFGIVTEMAERLGIEVQEEFRSGTSDANFIASQGTPVVDGMGPIGDLDHSDREYMIKDSLLPRTALLALSILEAWRRNG